MNRLILSLLPLLGAFFSHVHTTAAVDSESSSYIAVPTQCGNAASPNDLCAPFERHVLADATFCRPGRACYCCEGSCLTREELTSDGYCPETKYPPGDWIFDLGEEAAEQDEEQEEQEEKEEYSVIEYQDGGEDEQDEEFDDIDDDVDDEDPDAPYSIVLHEGDVFHVTDDIDWKILEVINFDRRSRNLLRRASTEGNDDNDDSETRRARSRRLRAFGRQLGSRRIKIRVTRRGKSKTCSGSVSGIKGCRRLGGGCCHSIDNGTVKCREGSRRTCRKLFGRKTKSKFKKNKAF